MKSEVSQGIRNVWHQVHSGNGIAFPKTVELLSQLGVSRYHVDYVAQTVTAYVGLESETTPSPDLVKVEKQVNLQHGEDQTGPSTRSERQDGLS
jgi:hypothetical protein